MEEKTISIVKNLLNTTKNIVVIGHKNPDGDAVGSTLALSIFLNKLGHNATVIMPNGFPDFLNWMPQSEAIILYDKNTEKSKSLIDDADIICTLDFNSFSRTGDLEPILQASKADFLMIDHHQQPDGYAVATYSDVTMCSTCQMVYHFIESLDGLDKLDAEIATNLYTGIMTDTGSFRFPSTTSTTHRVIANLMEAGAENSFIHEHIYDVNSPERMKLLGVALKNMHILPEYNTAYITLSQKELDSNNFKKGDTEGFVNYALSIKGVVLAAIFIEHKQENIIKMSLRSKGDFSVNDFARKYYNGGGHTNAAGGRSLKTLNKTVTEFISILPSHKSQLVNA